MVSLELSTIIPGESSSGWRHLTEAPAPTPPPPSHPLSPETWCVSSLSPSFPQPPPPLIPFHRKRGVRALPVVAAVGPTDIRSRVGSILVLEPDSRFARADSSFHGSIDRPSRESNTTSARSRFPYSARRATHPPRSRSFTGNVVCQWCVSRSFRDRESVLRSRGSSRSPKRSGRSSKR